MSYAALSLADINFLIAAAEAELQKLAAEHMGFADPATVAAHKRLESLWEEKRTRTVSPFWAGAPADRARGR